jgi:hypothetical protein
VSGGVYNFTGKTFHNLPYFRRNPTTLKLRSLENVL